MKNPDRRPPGALPRVLPAPAGWDVVDDRGSRDATWSDDDVVATVAARFGADSSVTLSRMRLRAVLMNGGSIA